ncbi:hypothetical protein [Methylobacterium symbioticum]|nr:hypothetical protein [Methylobacterium symbioticum]
MAVEDMSGQMIENRRGPPCRGDSEVVRAVDADRIEPVIDRRSPLDRLPVALDPLDRGPFGNIEIEVR